MAIYEMRFSDGDIETFTFNGTVDALRSELDRAKNFNVGFQTDIAPAPGINTNLVWADPRPVRHVEIVSV